MGESTGRPSSGFEHPLARRHRIHSEKRAATATATFKHVAQGGWGKRNVQRSGGLLTRLVMPIGEVHAGPQRSAQRAFEYHGALCTAPLAQAEAYGEALAREEARLQAELQLDGRRGGNKRQTCVSEGAHAPKQGCWHGRCGRRDVAGNTTGRRQIAGGGFQRQGHELDRGRAASRLGGRSVPG